MPVSAPEPRSPLAAFWPTLSERAPAQAGVRLAERRCRLTEVAARKGEEATVARLLPGGCLPLAPGRWLAVTPADLAPPEAAHFGGRASCIDVSGAHVALRLSGPRLAAIMPSLCRLDLATLQPGDVARTPMAQVPVLLAVVDLAPTYDLFVPFTFARHCAGAIVHAAQAHGGAAADKPPAPTGDLTP